ncbi:unnamed protein product [Cuscuta epithymum]|uniref:Beta-carotene isomerase D27-like C-terminal domain-containing protein n=1 Tax=Cuscuta epithymum TaxID=186058 RepID=A0AAV0DWR2_9ASTE|nr:unnamed protein product [Cuscuta epithymum]
MNANGLQSYESFTVPIIHHRKKTNGTMKLRRLRPSVGAEVIKSGADSYRTGTVTPSKNVYRDNFFDRLAINHLSQCIQAASGLRNKTRGYDGLVEAATAVSRNFDSAQQQKIVFQALQNAIPGPILLLMRMVLPRLTLGSEYCAAFTTLFFTWLVGPCEVKKAEGEEKREKNVVHIKKCRFLEESNCVGMCTNLCKIPSQTFIMNSLGMPVNMVPNFDDMSCEMIFGEHPPSQSEDPALNYPCYKSCDLSQKKHHKKCI